MPEAPAASERILLLTAPRDARIAAHQLADAGFVAHACTDMPSLCVEIEAGAGAAIVGEEFLDDDATERLASTLRRQPAWSDFPLLVVASRKRREHASHEPLDVLGNVTLLDPPLRIRTLLRSVRAALRARSRQYAARTAITQRDRFLAILGHELRNPLSAIALAAETAAPPGGDAAPPVLVIRRQVAHLTRLVDDLLDVARVTSGRIHLQREPMRIDALVGDDLLASMRPAFVEAGIELSSSLARDVWVEGDRVRLEQVVTNLLTNALKFTHRGGHVRVELRRRDGDAVLTVADDGAGIAPDVLPHVFEQFVQGESTLHRSEGGMGLGLSLVRTLVELHGGTVSAASEGRGHGATFVVSLPALPEQRATTPQRARAAEAPAAAARRVVVVEDNVDARELLVLALRRFGHDVAEASDGEEALNVLAEGEHDAAIVDLGLPKIDGYEVARRVRSKLGPDMLLVALSGYGQPEDVRRAEEAGYDVHLTKPADLATLCSVIGAARTQRA